MDRFHKNAHKALEKRTARFLLQEVFEGFQFVLFGSLPIVGLFYWEWQPLHLLVFLLVGAWVGLICDCFKLYFLKKAIMEYADGRYDDWHVWVVADALRKGQEKARAQHLRAKYQPGAGVIVDLTFGGIGTLMTYFTVSAVNSEFPLGMLRDTEFRHALIGFVSYQWLLTIWEILSHRMSKTSGGAVKVAVGLRGVGLFLLMFLVLMIVGDDGQNPEGVKYAMLIINGLLIFLGLVYITGPILLAGETQWLKRYLRERESESTDD